MDQITTVGVDLAKEVIVVCAGDASGRPVYFNRRNSADVFWAQVRRTVCNVFLSGACAPIIAGAIEI